MSVRFPQLPRALGLLAEESSLRRAAALRNNLLQLSWHRAKCRVAVVPQGLAFVLSSLECVCLGLSPWMFEDTI